MSQPNCYFFAYLSADSDAEFLEVKQKLVDFCVEHEQPITMDVEFPDIRIIFDGGFTFQIYFSRAPLVVAEAAELGQQFNEPRLADCQSRYEFYADEDPQKSYADDILQMQQLFESFRHVFIYEPQTEVLTYF
jgi:hypothetical protein